MLKNPNKQNKHNVVTFQTRVNTSLIPSVQCTWLPVKEAQFRRGEKGIGYWGKKKHKQKLWQTSQNRAASCL